MARQHWYVLVALALLALLALSLSSLLPQSKKPVAGQPTSTLSPGSSPGINATLRYLFLKPIKLGSTTLLSYLVIIEVTAINTSMDLSMVRVSMPEELHADLVVQGAAGIQDKSIDIQVSTLKSPGEGVIQPIVSPIEVRRVHGSGLMNDLLGLKGLKIYSSRFAASSCTLLPGQSRLIVVSGTIPLPSMWAEKLSARLSHPLPVSIYIEGRTSSGRGMSTMGIYVADLKHRDSAYIAGILPLGIGEYISSTC